MPVRYPYPSTDPFTDISVWIPYLLASVENYLDNKYYWLEADEDTALQGIERLKEYIMSLPIGETPENMGFGRIWLSYRQPAGTSGGALTANQWIARFINEKIEEPFAATRVSLLNATQFQIQPGTYYIRGWFVTAATGKTQLRLWDITNDKAVNIASSPSYAGSTDNAFAYIAGKFAEIAPITLEFQHRVQTTRPASGQGLDYNLAENLFGHVEITVLE